MANGNNIGLRITLGGTSEVINDIKQLEAALSKARQQLKGLAIGSEDFKKLSNEIKNADSQLKNLNEKAQGIKFEKKLQQFTQLGSTITASFAAAQAAIGLFGGESEKVAEAAAKAQNLLTIALVARELATAGTTLKTIANTVATVAQTAATTAATAATRALWLALAANPLTAILAVIGLVVTALVTLTGSTEDATKAEEAYQAALKKGNDERQFELQLLQAQGRDEEDLARKRLANAKEAEEIAKSAFQRAQTKSRFDETTEKRRQEADEATRQRILAQESLDSLLDENKKKRAEDLSNQRKKLAEERKQQIESEIAQLGELTRAEIARDLVGQKLQAAEFESVLAKRLELVKSLTSAYQKETDILTQYNKVFGTRDLLIDRDNKFIDFQIGLFRDLEKSVGLYGKTLQSSVEVVETAGNSYNEFGQQIVESDAALMRWNAILKDTERIELQEPFRRVYEVLQLISDGFKSVGSSISLLSFKELLADIVNFELGLNGVSYAQFIGNQQDLGKLQETFVEEYIQSQVKLEKTAPGYAKAVEEATKSGTLFFELLVKNQKEVLTFEANLLKTKRTLSELNEEIRGIVNDPIALNAFLSKNRDLITQSFTVDLGEVESNRNALLALDNIIATRQYNQAEGFRTEILALEEEFAKQGIDISKASDEEKLKLLKFYLGLEVTETENAEKKKQDAFQKTINKYVSSIQAVSSVLNSLAQLTSDYYATQLEKLDIQSEKAKSKIVGDTEEANQKRLEADKIYQEDRKRLEKEAATVALRISLGQAIANTAEAITKIFAQTGVVGIVAGSAIAAINAAQIGLISSQLSSLSSYQRGGYIKGQGGLIFGPSHENGGVKYQGGGVELEGGEAVINRFSAVQYRGLLDQINQAGGGRPLMSTNFDDSRILEALAKQRQTPIKTYVLESDVTNAQSINRRLELLSQI
jgi:hypothetical protein